MRRAYQTVAVEGRADGFVICLDGRALATPARATMVVPTRALAEAIAQEWRNQGSTISFASLPLTRVAGTAIDRIVPDRAHIIAELAAFAETDLLCYRASEPSDLVARQRAAWQPLLDWFSVRYDAPLTVTSGVVAQAQPASSLAALRGTLVDMDAFKLAALGVVVPATGSLVVGLALIEGRVTAAEAFAVAELDATFQIEHWGEQDEAKRRRDELEADLVSAARFLALLDDRR